MTTQSKNVPALRFPEFNGEWKAQKLGDIVKISSGGTPSRGNSNYWGGNYPWVTTSLIDFYTIYQTEEYITESGLKNSSAKLFPKDTILMAMYGQGKTRGKVGLLGIEATTNQACAAIITNKEKLDELFLFQNLAGRYDEIRNLSNSGGQENLSAELIKSIPVTFPSLPEQQKIAAFLMAIDEKIQQLTKKKDLLELYKKGVMQQIFNQDIRFKDDNGNDFADWEEKSFEEIFISIPTKQFQILTSEILESGDYPVIDQGQKEIAGYSNNEGKLFKDSPIIIFGDHTAILKYIDFNFIVGADGTKILKSTFGDSKFFYYCLVFNNIEAEGYKRHYSILKSINLQFPESVKEQQKIADFLSAIDNKISLVNQQLENTQTYKKGLLQQMFV